MSDLFISYSRRDSARAMELGERLRRSGIECWIDQSDIAAAQSWSAEIVDAIEGCKAFVVLLSEHSLASDHVARELSLAFESKRPLVPISLEDVALSRNFKYPLAGIQRVAYTQFDTILQALHALGLGATTAATKPAAVSSRKRILVLPFEDLSPTQDNQWFADGLAVELINSLSAIRSLKPIDRQTAMSLRERRLPMAELARLLEVRYFLEGTVRKFGEQIKITASLFDFEEGDYLWQDSHKGSFSDIFEIQESVAARVVSGLQLHLGSTEEARLQQKPTESAHAYELYLKGFEQFGLYTYASLMNSIDLYEQAIRVDAGYSNAYIGIAMSHLELWRRFEPSMQHLRATQNALDQANAIGGVTPRWCWSMSLLLLNMGELEDAEKYARQCISLDPEMSHGFNSLGHVLGAKGDYEGAVVAFERWLELEPDGNRFSVLTVLHAIGDQARLRAASHAALPFMERVIMLHPQAHHEKVCYAYALSWSGNTSAATRVADELYALHGMDPADRYNLACLLSCELHDDLRGFKALLESIETGFANFELLATWYDERPDLRTNEEFLEISRTLEKNFQAFSKNPET